MLGFDMNEKVAGVVGTGQIGRIMCEILRGLNMRVLAYDPYPNKDWAGRHGVEYVSLNDLYRNSDII
ncbi:MAG: NAD(P)-dependent oxidoreductase, partial [Actinomycetota bacterium]